MAEENIHNESNYEKKQTETETEQKTTNEGLGAHTHKAEEQEQNTSKNTEKDLLALEQENKQLKEQLLRLAADMENLRKRTARDVQDAKLYSVAQFARDMLSVSDNLGRALSVLSKDEREKDTCLNNLAEGVEMTERAMLSSLERHGVKKIEPLGEKFNPNFHQAMFEIPTDDVPNNIVQEVVQAGFIIGDRVLRPALVGVSKNTAKNTQKEYDNADDISSEQSGDHQKDTYENSNIMDEKI